MGSIIELIKMIIGAGTPVDTSSPRQILGLGTYYERVRYDRMIVIVLWGIIYAANFMVSTSASVTFECNNGRDLLTVGITIWLICVGAIALIASLIRKIGCIAEYSNGLIIITLLIDAALSFVIGLSHHGISISIIIFHLITGFIVSGESMMLIMLSTPSLKTDRYGALLCFEEDNTVYYIYYRINNSFLCGLSEEISNNDVFLISEEDLRKKVIKTVNKSDTKPENCGSELYEKSKDIIKKNIEQRTQPAEIVHEVAKSLSFRFDDSKSQKISRQDLIDLRTEVECGYDDSMTFFYLTGVGLFLSVASIIVAIVSLVFSTLIAVSIGLCCYFCGLLLCLIALLKLHQYHTIPRKTAIILKAAIDECIEGEERSRYDDGHD